MLCRYQSNPIDTLQMVCVGVAVFATVMDAHNMITTIMNTAA